MQDAKINKTKLLEILKNNREMHKNIYDKAVTNYNKFLLAYIEKMLTRAKKGKTVDHSIRLNKPTNNLRDYDRVIRMLELSEVELIELSEGEFSEYVLDDWTWKGQFSTTIAYSGYSGPTGASGTFGAGVGIVEFDESALNSGIFRADDINLQD